MSILDKPRSISHKHLLAIIIILVFVAGVITGLVIYDLFLAKPYVPPVKYPPPVIGIIRLYGYMLDDTDRELYVNSISYALHNNSIVAVVLRINSPGGYASIVEDVYYSLKILKASKPVIAVVEGLAASGGYYVALGSDYILAEPSSFVGNIGVIVYAPYIIIPSESILESGPYKLSGFSVKEFPFIVREAFNNFVKALKESRGDKLKVNINDVITGKLYLSTQAVKMGLIDDLGSFLDALRLAAESAKVTRYVIVDITNIISKRLNITSTGMTLWNNKTSLDMNYLSNIHKEPISVYYLSPYYIKAHNYVNLTEQYVPPPPYYYPTPQPIEFPLNLSRAIVVDSSHNNAFNPVLLNTFFGMIISHGYKVIMIDKTLNLTYILSKRPKALIIFTPLTKYSPNEIKAIKEYVNFGGKLLLIYDPAIAFATYINDIAQEFGLYFANGYLYDLNENYGIYRNIVITNFVSSPLTEGVNKLVLFTSTHVYASHGLALTSNSTVLSLTEEAGVYTPIVMEKDVIAIGDMTFMLDPFCGIADNKKFIENLVYYLVS